MHFIAHRGNVFGPDKECENRPDYIKKALVLGYDVEIDVWCDERGLYLGHDEPQYKVDIEFLEEHRDRLWCHAKNLEALKILLKHGYHCFTHDKDDYTLTSKRVIWAYPGKSVNEVSVMVMPEIVWHMGVYDDNDLRRVLGVCSDYIASYKEKFESRNNS